MLQCVQLYSILWWRQNRVQKLEQTSRHQNHARFTLIEMLVVISIIAALATMIGSAVFHAKESGEKALCLSNLRQVGLMHLQYADNNQGTFCPAWDETFCQWDSDNRYQEGGFLSRSVREAGDANNTEVFSCPAAKKKFQEKEYAPKFAGYGYNYMLSFASHKDFPPAYRWVKTGKVKRPGKVVIAADAAVMWSADEVGPTSFLNQPSSGTGGFVDFRHLEQANAVYVDGHCESRDMKKSGNQNEESLGYLSDDDSAYDPFFKQ